VLGELADGAVHAWVAKTGPGVIGFVTAAQRDPQRKLGEIGPGSSRPDEPYREIDWGSGIAGDASFARSVASSRNTAARPKVSPTVRSAS
jgi:hypothetical protein